MKDKYYWQIEGNHLQIVEVELGPNKIVKVERVIYNNKEGRKMLYVPLIMGVTCVIVKSERKNEGDIIKFIFSNSFKFFASRAE